MIITHETTIEEYEAWLATNPPISQLRKAVNATFRMVYASIRKIKKLFKRVKVRSCLTPKLRTVYPYEQSIEYQSWLKEIKNTRLDISIRVEALELRDKYRLKRWAESQVQGRKSLLKQIDDELTMEQLHHSALEILTK